jgi:hypothetical protein
MTSLHRLFGRVSLSILLTLALLCIIKREIDYHTYHQQSRDWNDEEASRRQLAGRQGLRYAVFGSSIAWGAGLASRFEAYPYQLSPKVDNYATYAGGPNFPAVCTETLVGDQRTYDVIVIDYFLRAPEGIGFLATKIRKRFPDAVIVFLKIWTANMLRRKLPDGSGYETLQAFQDRLLSYGFDNGSLDLISALQNDNAQWIFPPNAIANDAIQQAANSVNGFIHEMDQCGGDAKQFLINYLYLYDNSDLHGLLSQAGHNYFAGAIQGIVSNAIGDNSTAAAAIQGAANEWGRGDHCNLWFVSGHCEMTYSSNYQVVLYDDWHGKYALEINGPGWFNVTNPFNDPRHLYLSFVSTNKPGTYPQVTLTSLNGVVLNPFSATHKFRNGVDSPQTISVGVLPPGETTVVVQPIQTTSQPFRLVGFAITDEVDVPDQWTFTPPFNQ